MNEDTNKFYPITIKVTYKGKSSEYFCTKEYNKEKCIEKILEIIRERNDKAEEAGLDKYVIKKIKFVRPCTIMDWLK